MPKLLSGLLEALSQFWTHKQRGTANTKREDLYEFLPTDFDVLEDRTMLAADAGATEQLLLEDLSTVESPDQSDAPAVEVASDESTSSPGMQELLARMDESSRSRETSDAHSKSIPNSHESVYVASTAREIVFVDAAIKDYESLVAGIVQDRGAIDVIVLDSERDGIQQITEALRNYSDVSAIHILSDGESGTLQLGSTLLTGNSLDAYSDAISSWSAALADGADILLYGCNVANGEWGVDFVQDFAAITGADVAASDDLTGNAELGGDWDFEYSTGVIQAGSVFSASAMGSYQYTLAIAQVGDVLTITGTEGDDNVLIVGTDPFTDGGLIVTLNGDIEAFTGVERVVFDGLGGDENILIGAPIDLLTAPIGFISPVIGTQLAGITGLGIEFEFNGGAGNLDIDSTRDLTVVNRLVTQGDLSISAPNIRIENNTIVSSRTIAGTDLELDVSVGDSGMISISATTSITVDPGAKILADVVDGVVPGAFVAGDVSLDVEQRDFTGNLSIPLELLSLLKDVSITANGATIRGGEISLTASSTSELVSPVRPIGASVKATSISIEGTEIEGSSVTVSATTADTTELTDEIPPWVNNFPLKLLSSAIFDGILPPIPIAVMIRIAGTSVDLTDATIISSGDVSIASNTVVDSTTAALAIADAFRSRGVQKIGGLLNHLSAGYSQAEGSATATLGGDTTINAGGDVTIKTDAKTTAAVSARTTLNIDDSNAPANTKNIGGSLAATYSKTTSQAIVEENATIVSGGNVNVLASAKVKNKASSSVNIYVDGLGGLGIAVAVDDADVEAIVDGQITAAGAKSAQDLVVSNIDPVADTISLPGHGLNPGDEVFYLAEDSNLPADERVKFDALGDLVDGTTYRVIVVDGDTIQLARTTNIDLDATRVDPAATQTFARRTTVTFDPQTAVDPALDTITLPGHEFVDGQEVDYAVLSDDQEVPTGLLDRATYFVIEVDTDSFQLAETEADAAAGIAIDLLDTGVGITHLFAFEQPAIEFNASSAVSTPDETITLIDHGLSNGDALVYRTDPTRDSTQVASRFSLFDPDAQVDTAANRITVTNNSFDTGQQVFYTAGDGTPVGGLVEGQEYFAIRIDADTLQLATSRTNASAGIAIDLTGVGTGELHGLRTDKFVHTVEAGRSTNVVDTATNSIELPAHSFVTGDEVTYRTSGGDPIGGLAAAADFFVIAVDANTIQLAATAQDAIDGIAIVLTAGATIATGRHAFEIADDPNIGVLFDPTDAPPVDTAADTLKVFGHRLETGDQFAYLTNGDDPIGGLADGTDYFAIVLDDDTIQFAATEADALAGNAIDLSAGATGFLHGIEVPSTVTVADREIGGLERGEIYYVTVVDADTIRLSESPQDALAATPLDLPALTGARLDEIHTLKTDLGSGVKIAASLKASNTASSGASIGGGPGYKDLLTKGEFQNFGLNAMQPGAPSATTQIAILKMDSKNAFKGQNSQPNELFSVSAGFGVNFVEHDVVAKIGATGVVKSGTDVTVAASASQKAQLSVQGSNSPDDGDKKFTAGVAVGFGFYDNNVFAGIDGGAVVDATNDLAVTSSLTYPLLSEPIDILPFASLRNISSFEDAMAVDVLKEVATLLSGKLGVTKIINNFAATKVGSAAAKLSTTGSLLFADYANDSQAIIGAGALVNQDEDYRDPDQTVKVAANTTMELVSAAGILHIKLQEAGVKNAITNKNTSKAFTFIGNKAGQVGLGGSAVAEFIDNDTIARIEDGAKVHTGTDGGLKVSASEDVFHFQFVQSGGEAGRFGLSVSVGVLDHDSETIAQLESGVDISGGAVDVSAAGVISHISLIGAVQLGDVAGIGISVGVAEVDRDTLAIIGDRRDGDDDPVGSNGTTITASSVNLDADSDGEIWTFALAGAKVTEEDGGGAGGGGAGGGAGAGGGGAVPPYAVNRSKG